LWGENTGYQAVRKLMVQRYPPTIPTKNKKKKTYNKGGGGRAPEKIGKRKNRGYIAPVAGTAELTQPPSY